MNEEIQTNANKRWVLLGLLVAAALAGAGWYWQKPSQPPMASISLPKTELRAGDKQTLPIEIDTAGQAINAAEVYIKFNPQLIQVESVSTDGSVFSIQIKDQPAFSNERGEISFAGGLPTPGFAGRGKIGSVTLAGKVPGQARLIFDQRTQMLLNDGLGTAVSLRLDPVIVNIQ
jgi:hypothetical protein